MCCKSKEKKEKKKAESSAAIEAYDEILDDLLPPCTKCKKLQATVDSLQEQLQDCKDAIEAKKVEIAHLSMMSEQQGNDQAAPSEFVLL